MIFYLDAYNLIRVKNEAKLLDRGLRVFCNEREIHFEVLNENEYLSLKLNYEYKDRDEIIVFTNNEKYEVVPRYILFSKRFDNEYKVDVDILGSFIEGEKTVFRLWAPLSKKAYVVINNKEYLMDYLGKGLYVANVNFNCDECLYHYKVLREKMYEFSDPFSYVDKEDESYVLDDKKLVSKIFVMEKVDNPIIYEINIRDFSSGENLPFMYPRKLLALSEEGLKIDNQSIGVDYLENLGVSHLQLMPIFTYDYDNGDYNWGYNPLSYNTIFKDYLVSEKPYEQIREVQNVFTFIHKKHMRITLDVVFNHVYKASKVSLNKMLPYYFFRYKNNDELADGTFCGNEIRSEAYFVREYLKLLCKRLIRIYDIDGLRFDLMGILDYQTMNEIKKECLKIKEDFLVYGEGWNMGEVLPREERASIENANKLESIAFFNDSFRNVLRGKTFTDEGYLFGCIKLKDDFKRVLEGRDLNCSQSINYIECHDNFSFFDKVSSKFNDEYYIKKICKLGLAVVVLSRGLPFIHSGQEFLRTKNGIDNTYNLGDKVNHLDWYRKNKYIEVSEYLRKLIELKNKFSFSGNEISFNEYYEVLLYNVGNMTIFINPCIFDHIYSSDDYYHLVFDENGFTDEFQKDFKIPSFSVVVAMKVQ